MNTEFVDRGACQAGGRVASPLLAVFFLWLVYAATTASYAADPACDETLIPSKHSTRYAQRGSRCEGLYSLRKVSDATLALVGYVKGNFDYALDPTEVIEVHVSSNVPRNYNPVTVRAEAYSLSTYYRMDSVLRLGEVLSWPVGEVLLHERIHAESIGVRGVFVPTSELLDGINSIHIPVRVRTSRSGSDDDQRVRLYLRSSQDIDYLSSTWICPPQERSQESRRIYRGGKPIVVLPPRGLKGLCLVSFLGVIEKRDSGGEGNHVALRLLLYLSD